MILPMPSRRHNDPQRLLDMLKKHAEEVNSDSPSASLELELPSGRRRFKLKNDLDQTTREQIESEALAHVHGPYAVLRVLSPHVVQTVDRAARSAAEWMLDSVPEFLDPVNQHRIEYKDENQSLEAMHRSIMDLNPRVADVWRLITATSLEAWEEGQSEPPAVWLDVQDLLAAMGFTKHHKGGYRPEHLEQAAAAIATLCNMWIVAPLGSKIYPENPASKRRKGKVLTAARSSAVLLKVAVDEIRDLFGNAMPMRWQVRPGTWIRDYPRTFAPMLKALVELNATGAINIWAKSIGTELTYLRAEKMDGHCVLTVEHLLLRSGLLREVEKWSAQRNAARAYEYLENALHLLQKLNLFSTWRYDPQDQQELELTKRTERFRRWMSCKLEVEFSLGELFERARLDPPTD
jgi:hypothetical protein